MELKEFNRRLSKLYLPLDEKIQDETASPKEIIEFNILKDVWAWSENITIDETEDDKENRRIISLIVDTFKESGKKIDLTTT